MATGIDPRREEFKRYKEDVEREGKPFFPYAVLHDSIMSLVVVVVIIGLACVWYYSADGTEAGILGPWYTEEADPGTIEFVPRPDWFFYFLFYLLRIFKWPESVVLGTVGIPTILLILLLSVPFYDRRPERRPLRGEAGSRARRAVHGRRSPPLECGHVLLPRQARCALCRHCAGRRVRVRGVTA